MNWNSKNTSQNTNYSGQVDISNTSKPEQPTYSASTQNQSLSERIQNSYTNAKNKTIYWIKTFFLYIICFGLIFWAVILATTNNWYIKSIYWKLWGWDSQLRETQQKLENKRQEISNKVTDLKRFKEEASWKFIELQTAEIKIRDTRNDIEILSKEASNLQKSINDIVNSNVVKWYENDDKYYTIDGKTVINTGTYNQNLDKKVFPTLSTGSTTVTSTWTTSKPTDNKVVIEKLLKEVSKQQKVSTWSVKK